MPKVSIYKDSHASLRKDEIRLARQVGGLLLKRLANTAQQPLNLQLQVCVSGSDARHAVAALFPGKVVSQMRPFLDLKLGECSCHLRSPFRDVDWRREIGDAKLF